MSPHYRVRKYQLPQHALRCRRWHIHTFQLRKGRSRFSIVSSKSNSTAVKYRTRAFYRTVQQPSPIHSHICQMLCYTGIRPISAMWHRHVSVLKICPSTVFKNRKGKKKKKKKNRWDKIYYVIHKFPAGAVPLGAAPSKAPRTRCVTHSHTADSCSDAAPASLWLRGRQKGNVRTAVLKPEAFYLHLPPGNSRSVSVAAGCSPHLLCPALPRVAPQAAPTHAGPTGHAPHLPGRPLPAARPGTPAGPPAPPRRRQEG